MVEITLVPGPGAPTLPGRYARPAVAFPAIDWATEAALVVDMGEQRTGGYGVTVTDVRQGSSGEIELLLGVRRPDRNAFVAQVITHPYAVAKVPRAWLQGGGTTVVARDQNGQEVARQVVQL
jgi:hypothetical protein